jgi:ubiquinone/menaquinone biosynthesis C-methylase UbiE
MIRLDLQHYAIQHICRKRYFAPLEEPRRIIDIGCGTGTWMLVSHQNILCIHMIYNTL